jgi:hypothetical protein
MRRHLPLQVQRLLAFVIGLSLFGFFLNVPLLSSSQQESETAKTVDGNVKKTADGNTGRRFHAQKIRTYRGPLWFQQHNKSTTTTTTTSPFPVLTKPCPKWAVVTTIFDPSDAVRSVAELSDWCLVIVGDTKTRSDYVEAAKFASTATIYFLSAKEQLGMQNSFVKTMPYKSFARKNVGFLFAIRHGAQVIYDFDDDNLLLQKADADHDHSNGSVIRPFVNPHNDQQTTLRVRVVLDDNHDNRTGKPFNPYPLMRPSTADDIWPRGFPLEDIQKPFLSGLGSKIQIADLDMKNVGVLQSVCNGDPDVDAVYRLTRTLPVTFDETLVPLLVPPTSYAPYNAQATVYRYPAFWGLLLPHTVPGRVTDIWRSYFTQRIFQDLQLSVVYVPPIVTHTRNSHDYMADMAAEDDLYRKTNALLQFLQTWKPSTTTRTETTLSLPAMLEQLAIALYEHDYMGLADVTSAQQWLLALRDVGYRFPSVPPKSTNSSPMTTDVTKQLPSIRLVGAATEASSTVKSAAPTSSTVKTAAPAKRWAVMMTGSARTYSFCRETFFENVVNQSNLPMDLFSYSFLHQDTECHIDTLGMHELSLDSTVMRFDDNFVKHGTLSTEAAYDRFVRQQIEHLEVIEMYAKEHNLKYDYIFYTRPDLLYTKPFNMTLLEEELENRRNASGWFTPLCCKFGGLCDRLAAGIFEDWAHMIRSAESWWKAQPKKLIGERAFKARAEFVNLTNYFDLPKGSYSFSTVRRNNIRDRCEGLNTSEYWRNGWVDTVCEVHRDFVASHIPTIHAAACTLLNKSSCEGDINF